jgi:hypothetical protein
MTLILAILLGLIAGQYIKLSVDPALLDFTKSAWSSVALTAPDIKEKFTGLVAEAVTTAKQGALQKAVKKEFKKIDAEVKTNG